ncbi:phosphate ABC transporter permease PstA [Chelativorans intermedius]|uniref:Phosphate transport system permease protein PstA n=1 Tax=Chelativorans intermedius TaxID=515947 RepID=A0ABV6DAM0_9HYPH|nr:phosphate ABC transporter permease PstA [Chelativorans intermedius]MCT8997967.1 phosphate ABC transporter permease PstA [Chelativorans intermedius]
MSETTATAPKPFDWSSPEAMAKRKRRYAADRRLRLYGLVSILVAIGLLGILIASLVVTGYSAFVQTKIAVEFTADPENVPAEDPGAGNFRAVVSNAVQALFPEIENRRELRTASKILSNGATTIVRNHVIANPGLVGQTFTLEVPASDPFDQLNKGVIDRNLPEDRRRVSDAEIELFESLEARGLVSTPFNWGLFFNADSRFPELAGLAGAVVGSFYALLVCFLISFPVGIAAAIYLEEFAPKNRWTDLVEVNINNLAAVPSIVFGLLGLAVFIQVFGLPRSAPLVGGMVLSLMTLPTMIIVTRAALKSIPPSIREAALGIGASKHEVILHHVLPLALPGILTGTIIGLAQALGETAPLLLIGMNAFLTSPPGGIMDPATALPTQIFIWADSPERGFASRTSAAILVLLGFLIFMNAVAIYLRQRFERRW